MLFTETAASRSVPRLPASFDEHLAALAAVGLGVTAGFLVRAVGLADVDAALVVMGFDPDRARLIDALVVAFVSAAGARLATDRPIASTLAGLATFAVAYEHVFRGETSAALKARGIDGQFDAGGWLVTGVTLIVVAALIAGAASLLGGHVRAFVVTAAQDAAAVARTRRIGRDRASRPAALVVAATLVAIVVPIFGDIVNFAPDVHMVTGAKAPAPLVGPNGGVADGSAAGQVDNSPPAPAQVDAPRGTLASATPWTAWRPSGSGRLVRTDFPAPWTGGRASSAAVTVYLPPGYDTSPGRRYPVVYEAPFMPGPLAPFQDSYFTSGLVAPEIVVYVSAAGGPYPDDECADSCDGREHFESYLIHTVVPWVDAQYRTIPDRAARTIYGDSQGGFCAAMLLLRHPDVFQQGISLSGYYTAGVISNQTLNAYRPFGGDQKLIASYSPIDVAPALPADVRSRIFLVISGEPAQPFYGPQVLAFDAALAKAGIPHAVIHDTIPHSWRQFGQDLPTALRLVARRQVSLGVFGPP
jgi:esterase/lipase superfamily enzyme